MFKSNKRLVEIAFVVLLSSFIGMIGGAVTIYTLESKVDRHVDASKIAEIDNMYNTIISKYYDTVDEEKIIKGAVEGMLSVLDANTTYMDQTTTSSFNKKMQGEYYGIGVEALGVDGSGVLVVSVVNNSPAYNSGIKEGDIITKANGEDLSVKGATYFTEMVAKTSEEIKLEVSRKDRVLNISVLPEKVVIPSVTTNRFTISGKNIGYIKISIFAANTASQFATELKKLEEQGINSLVIDVRDNSGGYLSGAASILEMFMGKGEILYQTESKTSTVSRKDETDESRNYPVAILVNGSSASASEVLTACLMENHNAIVVGTTTYGKGTVQETIGLSEGSMAKITTKKWLTPNGNWINEKGITPTIAIGASDKYVQNPSFDNDNQLNKAISELIRK